MTKTTVKVNDIEIDITRKNIKNIHLAVYPPDARVKISAPMAYDAETIRLFAASKLGWIRDNIDIIKKQKRVPPKDYVSGESHYLFGKRYMLKVFEDKKSYIEIKGVNRIHMYIKSDATREDKKNLMDKWYRDLFAKKLEILIPKWEGLTSLKINSWQIKKMKRIWGSCNIDKRKIYLNPELAKTNIKNIEYIILHELSHLVEHTHNKDFVRHIEKHMPNWELYKRELNEITYEI